MVGVGVIAFAAVLGWWLGLRPAPAAPAWLVGSVAAATGVVVVLTVGRTGLPGAAVGFLTGAGAAVLFRWVIRRRGSEQGEESS